MESLEFINQFSIWSFFAFSIVVLLLFAFGAYALGFKLGVKAKLAPTEMISTNVLGLLALILGFSFSMALERYEHRRVLVVEEANAISTVYLRTDVIGFKDPRLVKKLFTDYVDLRLNARAYSNLNDLLNENQKIQNQIWKNFQEVTVKSRGDIEAEFMQSLNNMFDLGNARFFAMKKMLPASFYLLILIIASAAVGLMNFDRGIKQEKTHWRSGLFILLFGILFSFIYDIDHFRGGFIQISIDPITMLRKSM